MGANEHRSLGPQFSRRARWPPSQQSAIVKPLFYSLMVSLGVQDRAGDHNWKGFSLCCIQFEIQVICLRKMFLNKLTELLSLNLLSCLILVPVAERRYKTSIYETNLRSKSCSL